MSGRGRPPLFGEPARCSIRVRVTEEQRRDLTRIARTNRTDIAGVIRDAVNEYVADFRDRLCFVGQK